MTREKWRKEVREHLGTMGSAASAYFLAVAALKNEGFLDKSWWYVFAYLGVSVVLYTLSTLLED